MLGIELHDDPIKFNISEDQNIQRYVAGLYWSTITMATIGYGDVVPKTTVGRIYVSIVSLISCGIFGYSINQIGEIVTEIQQRSEQFNAKMQQLNKLMKSRDLSKELMYQVLKYYEYLHDEEEDCDELQAMDMIESLPKSMKEKIMYEMNHKLLYEQKTFSLNFSKAFIDKLSIKVKSMKMGPETDLFKQDEFDQKLYFIQKGSIVLYFQQNQTQKEYAIQNKGDMIGEIEFFGQQGRTFGAKSLTVVNVLYIEFEDFYNTIKLFEKDFETYNQMKDKLKLEGNLKTLNKRCQSCGSFNHLLFNCNRIQYTPNTQRITKELISYYPQERDLNFERGQKKSFNALVQFFQIGMELQDFMITNGFKQGTEYFTEGVSIGQTLPNIQVDFDNFIEKRKQSKEEEDISLTVIKEIKNQNELQIQQQFGSSLSPKSNKKRGNKTEITKITALLDQTSQFQEENFRQRELSKFTDQSQLNLNNNNNNNYDFNNESSTSNVQNSVNDQPQQASQRKIDSFPNVNQLEKQTTRKLTGTQFKANIPQLQKNDHSTDYQEIGRTLRQIKLKQYPSLINLNPIMQQSIGADGDNNRQQILWFTHFDRAKNYVFYFPHNNIDKILKEIKFKQPKQPKKKRKKNREKPVSSFFGTKVKVERQIQQQNCDKN